MLRLAALTVLLLLAVVLALASADVAHGAWRWPLRGEVARAFAVGADRYAAGQHRGIDVRARPGTPVRAACAGRVRFAGRVARHGGVVSVRCGTFIATYLGLGPVAVRRGAAVRAGQRLGAVGAAAHLHLGARRGGRYLDPLSLLAAEAEPPPGLGPAPRPRTPAWPARPAAPPPARAPAPATRPATVPAVAWAGLALVAAALPLGGALARQRSRRRTSWTSTSPARRATSSAR